MCEPTTWATIISAVTAAGGTAYSAVQTRRAQNAQDQAAAAETARQRRIQQTQSRLIADQESNKEKGRKAFQELQPQLGVDATKAAEATAGADRGAAYQQAVQPVSGADPTAGASADTAVVDTVADTPVAVRGAYDAASAKGKDFSNQQAGARAFLDALADAQRQAGVTVARGAEEIGMYGDFVSGTNRPLNAWESVKNNQAAFQTAATNAAQIGADGQAIGSAIGQLGQLGYAYATRPQQGYYGTPVTGTRFASQRPIT
jgi:hypothetical protein